MIEIDDVRKIINQQEEWRSNQCINLIASENAQSPLVKELMVSDFVSRYAEGHPNTPDSMNRYYQGTKYIDILETIAREEMKELLGCKFVDVRPISGNMANNAVFFALLAGGDPVISVSGNAGGHISAQGVGALGKTIQISESSLLAGFSLILDSINSLKANTSPGFVECQESLKKTLNNGDLLQKLKNKIKKTPLYAFPMNNNGYHIDLDRAGAMINQVKPRLVVLGRSLFLFPEPIKEIAEICQEKKIPILYDAAHVFGLIAGGCFQQPLAEGASLMTASVHKTFPGPQRAIIASNMDHEASIITNTDKGVFPGTSSNHHLYNLPPLIASIREMRQYGFEYAEQTIKNAKTLAQNLDQRGIKVEGEEFGFTESHQVAIDVASLGGGRTAATRLEENDIILNFNMLPHDKDPKNPRGLRIGVQEMTRFGMKEAEMEVIADLICKILIQKKSMKDEVNQFRRKYTRLEYC